MGLQGRNLRRNLGTVIRWKRRWPSAKVELAIYHPKEGATCMPVFFAWGLVLTEERESTCHLGPRGD